MLDACGRSGHALAEEGEERGVDVGVERAGVDHDQAFLFRVGHVGGSHSREVDDRNNSNHVVVWAASA